MIFPAPKYEPSQAPQRQAPSNPSLPAGSATDPKFQAMLKRRYAMKRDPRLVGQLQGMRGL